MEPNQNLSAFFSTNTTGSGGSPGAKTSGELSGFLDSPTPTGKKTAPVSADAIRSIAAQEGADNLLPIINALYGQESGGGTNGVTSIDGARGGMQIMPDTFKRYAKAGESIDNQDDNMRVGVRIVKDLANKFGNDPAKIATGYFSGEGNVNAGQGSAWKNDRTDGNGKAVSAYVADVVKRVGGVSNAGGATLPDLAKAPKWADVEAKAEFKALAPEKQAEAKAAYFDYWIAPRAGERAGELRQKFLTPAQTTLAQRTWGEAAADTAVQLAEGVNTIFGAVPNLVAPESDAAEFFNNNADFWREKQSQSLRGRLAIADKEISKAGEDGVIAQIAEASSQYFSDPAMAARFVTTNLPSMIPGIGAAKLAQAAAIAKGASAAKAAGVATTAAGGVNAVLNAGGARGEAFDDIKRTLIEQGMSPQEAEQRAIEDSRVVAAVGGIAGFVSGKIGLEKALVGGAGKGGVRAGVGAFTKELAGEQIEEVAPQMATNVQAGQYDNRNIGKNVGRTIVETGIGSGPGAVFAGGVEALNRGEPTTPAASVAADVTPDGRIEPTLGGTQPVAPAEDAGAPAIHPIVQAADDIVRELATQHGIPLETVLPTQAEPPQDAFTGNNQEATTDQDVIDFASSRYQQLREKQNGKTENVVGDNGEAVDQDMPGVGLSTAEQQEFNGLEQAKGDVTALRALYGFDQITNPVAVATNEPGLVATQENANAQNNGQGQEFGPAPSQGAILDDGQPVGAVSQQDPAGQAPAAQDDGGDAIADTGQQVQTNGTLTVPLADRSEEDLRQQLRNAGSREVTSAIGAELQRRKQPKTEKEARAQRDYSEKLFGTADKAKAFIDKQGIGATHEAAKDATGKKFIIKKKETANGTQATQAVQAKTQGQEAPTAAEPVKPKTEREAKAQRDDNAEFLKALEEARKELPAGYEISPQRESISLMENKRHAVNGIGRTVAGVQEALRLAKQRAQATEPAADDATPLQRIEAAKPDEKAAQFANNKLFTQSAVEKARARMKSKLGQLNSGLDPELMIDGVTIAGAYIESGVRTFSAYSKAMIEDFGDKIRPYLRSFYEGVRHYPGLDTTGMSTSAEIDLMEKQGTAEHTNIAKPAEPAQNASKEPTNASPVQPKPVPERVAGQAQEDAATGNRDSEPLGAGMAAGGEGSDRGESVSGRAQEPRAAGARGVESAGQQPLGTPRDSAGSGPKSEPTTGEQDFVIDAEDIGKGGLAKKYKDNVAAIRIIKAMEAEGRVATPDERKQIAKYAGWGAIKGVFDPENKQWAKQHEELKELLTDAEYRAARKSVLDAHYTSPVAVGAMYDAMARLGFTGGRVLEPSVGVGNFFGLMPTAMRNASQLHGVELDSLTSRLVAALYPKAKIAQAKGFEDFQIPAEYFDAVIGNPPFGSQPLVDAERSPYSGFSIHNYFLAKGIDKLRPGGIMQVVVSHNFLDANDGRARKWISERANLIGAVRMPNTAFKENAGTDVVTDILIFQKKSESEAANGIDNSIAPWANVVDQVNVNPKTGESATHKVNQYFVANPQHVLGKPSAAGNMYAANEYTVEATGDIKEQLAGWVKTLPTNIFEPVNRKADTAVVDMAVPDGVKTGSFYVDAKGKVMQRGEDVMGDKTANEWVPPNEKAVARMKGMIALRESLRTQMRLERSQDATVNEIKANRAELNTLYDAFLKAHGHLNSQTNRRLFLDDTEAQLLQALEFDYDKGVGKATAEREGIDAREPSATKADIFNRRVAFPPQDFMTVTTAKDALLASLNYRGKVDTAYMAEVYAKSPAEIVNELGDVVYEDPQSGIVTADEYLSGDVKTKLAEAQAAAKDDAKYKRNVDALEKVIPKDKKPSEISVSIGASFVPAEFYQQFVKHISGGEATAVYIKATGQWLVDFKAGVDAALNTGKFGTSELSAQDLFQLTMLGRGAVVKKTYKNPDGGTTTVVLEKETEAAREKQNAIKAEWQSWLWGEAARADKVAAIYNDKMNRIVERKYDGQHLTFPGMNPAITLLEHQKNGVWRGLQSFQVLYDHVVGAGKTFEMATLAMEMRRLGVARKPLFVVPNHLTLQWRSEFTRLYPGSNILAATPEDFSKDNRERLFSKIITGDWDAVVIGHSSLKKIGLPEETEKAVLQEQIDEVAAAIEQMKREKGHRNIIRDMEGIRSRLEAKMKDKLASIGKRSKVVTFDELGIDAMFVDEMHEFKNLTYNSTMDRNPGMGNPAGSSKAFDMFVKVRWLFDTFGDKTPFITATGTPVSNSLVEMYNMQRYMQYPTLKREGLHVFDAWAKQFGSVENVYEVAPSGSGYRQSTRFAKFTNLPGLMGLYNSFADTITLDDLKAQEEAQGKRFPVPKMVGGRPVLVVAKRSPAVAALMGVPKAELGEDGKVKFLADLDANISFTQDEKSGKWIAKVGDTHLGSFDTEQDAKLKLVEQAVTPKVTVAPASILGRFANLRELTKQSKGKVNALSLTGEANKAGLDYRLINPSAPDFAGSKINLAVDRMMTVYKQWDSDKGTQLVFCDMSIPLSARASYGSKERRLYVRDDAGAVSMKRGTMHTLEGFESLPYFVVQRGDKDTKRFDVYDAAAGVLIVADSRNKADAREAVNAMLIDEDQRQSWIDKRQKAGEIEQEQIDEYNNDNDVETEGFEFFNREDIAGVSGSAKFSVYDDIKAKLIAKGVPEREIAFIHDYATPTAKDKLFKAVNSGEIRFLLGSTPKMGAGTNVQKRLVGLHHIDAPWRPSDLEQREGRIIRRGNELYERDPEGFEVFIGRYATEQTYDTRRWQILEHKARGIEQLRTFDGTINEIDDIEGEAANSADMKAAASGDPMILEETRLRNDVRRLEQLQAGHADEVLAMTRKARDSQAYADKYGPRQVDELQSLIATTAKSPVDKDGNTKIVVDGKEYGDKEAAQAAIAKAVSTVRAAMADEVTINYRGIEFTVSRPFGTNVVADSPTGSIGQWIDSDPFSASGFVQRLANYVGRLPAALDDTKASIAKAAKDAVALAEQAKQPFAQAKDLEAAREEYKKVQRALLAKGPAVPDSQKAAVQSGIAAQRAKLEALGYGEALREFFDSGDEAGQFKDISQKKTQTDTPAFKRWFGDSKVVDADGKPLVVYHSTYGDFTEFELGRRRDGSDEPSSAFYFSDAPMNYAPGGEMVEAYVSIKRPLDLRSEAGVLAINTAIKDGDLDSEITRGQHRGVILTTDNLWAQIERLPDPNAFVNGVIAWAEDNGYDGLIHGDYLDGEPHTSYAAFNPTQIKSAIGNNGEFDPANPSILRDLSTAPSAHYESTAEPVRVNAMQKLEKLGAKLEAGKITEAEFVLATREITNDLRRQKDSREARELANGRRRGADWVVAQLRRYVADEAVDRYVVDFAEWLLDQNPQLANDLGVGMTSKREGAAGDYNDQLRVFRLVANSASDGTAVHEILHHTERMMPAEVQDGVLREWRRSWDAAYKAGDAKLKEALVDMLKANLGNQAAHDRVRKAFNDGTLVYEDHYQLYSPSEFWAVNGTRILSGRYEASGSWVARAVQWFKEFIQHIKAAFGLNSDAPVIKALEAVMNGDGAFQPKARMLAHRSGSVTVERTFNDITRTTQNNLIQFFGNRDKTPSLKTFGAYDKTLSTQFNKALKDRHFGKVLGLANAMQNEVSLTSIRPAELAPGVLPRVDDVKSAARQLVKGKKADKNLDDASRAIFAGTLDGNSVLEGRVWNDDELRNMGLTDAGIGLYKQARAAVDASLDEVAASEAYAMAQGLVPKTMRRAVIDNPRDAESLIGGEIKKQIKTLDTAIKAAKKMGNEAQESELKAARTSYVSTLRNVEKIFVTAKNLKAAGYAPLMRFGKFTVTVQAIDPETGNVERDADGEAITLFYGQYETEGEAQAVRAQMDATYKDEEDVRVKAGTKAQTGHELYAGISPETLALFAEAIGADSAMRKHIELAMTERSALKRRLHRNGTEGYSEDLPRVLSNFITSNGRHAAQRYYLRDLNNAIKYIPKEKGDVVDEALALKKFMVNPNDPAAPVSSAMFAWFLGGSVASALVNLSQPIMMTGPYLSQFGVTTATKAMTTALPYAMGKKQITDEKLRDAIKRASQEGIVDAQEIFHLYSVGAQGVASGLVNTLSKLPVVGGKVKAGGEDLRARTNAFLTLWGSMFALAEGFNRKLTFIAAWEVAKANGEKNPYAFAVRAVNETQGIYNKVNRPNWARGPVGRTILTFKQFSLMYMELLSRMWNRGGPEGKRAALIMLAVLMLAAGEEGLPFAQDLDDLIDTVGQMFGYDTNMKRSKRRVAHEILGKQLGDLFLYGVSSMLPLDFAGRLGLGNLIPGSGLLKPSDSEMRGRQVAEIFGPTAGMATQIGDAYDAATEGNMGKAMQNLAPTAIKNLAAGGEMAKKGYATDSKGRKVVDVNGADAAIKSVGFNPTKVAEESRKTAPVYQDIALQKKTETSIVDQWVRGIVDQDSQMALDAQRRLEAWNKANPDTTIKITPDQIRNKARSMLTDKDARLLKQAPREMRGRLGLDLAK